MKIFISHAIKDHELIDQIRNTFEPQRIEFLIVEHTITLKGNITEKTELMINDCDAAIFLLTQSGCSSKFVQQEIGYVHSVKKPSLQLVEIGQEGQLAGFNFGWDYIPLDPTNPEKALRAVQVALVKFWEQKRAEEDFQLQRIEHSAVMARIEEQNKIHSLVKVGLLALGLFLVFKLLGND